MANKWGKELWLFVWLTSESALINTKLCGIPGICGGHFLTPLGCSRWPNLTVKAPLSHTQKKSKAKRVFVHSSFCPLLSNLCPLTTITALFLFSHFYLGMILTLVWMFSEWEPNGGHSYWDLSLIRSSESINMTWPVIPTDERSWKLMLCVLK